MRISGNNTYYAAKTLQTDNCGGAGTGFMESLAEKEGGSIEGMQGEDSGRLILPVNVELWEQYRTFVQSKQEELIERMKKGENEPVFQIGGSSFSQTEWEKLLEKVDHVIEEARKEAEARSGKKDRIAELLKDRDEQEGEEELEKETRQKCRKGQNKVRGSRKM